MTTSSNAYCAVLGIRAPRVEDAMSSPAANHYSLLLVALIERGEPMTLEEAAARLAAAGVAATPGHALASLKRCKPARAPIYRDRDHYALDPHDDEVSFWLFRLGLRPPRVAPLKVVRSALHPLRYLREPSTFIIRWVLRFHASHSRCVVIVRRGRVIARDDVDGLRAHRQYLRLHSRVRIKSDEPAHDVRQ